MKSKIKRLGKVSITVEKEFWNINKAYDRLTIVERQGTRSAYMSRKAVPVGVSIEDRNYWITISKWADVPYEIVQEFGNDPDVGISQKVLTETRDYLQDQINNIEHPEIDSTPTRYSTNTVQSGGVFDALQMQDSIEASFSDDGKIYNNYKAGDIFYIEQDGVHKYRVAYFDGIADDEHPITIDGLHFYFANNAPDAIFKSILVKNVSTNQQQLTSTQKATARENIAAVAYEKQNLTSAQQVQLQNNMIGKEYAPANFSGLGKKVFTKNVQTVGDVNKNIMTQAFFEDAQGNPLTNTVFVIQYDYELSEDITIPENCVLQFEGGSISGNGVYALTFQKTELKGIYRFGDVLLNGTLFNNVFYISTSTLFANNSNISDLISHVINNTNVGHFVFENSFTLTKAIRVTRNGVMLEGRVKGEERCTLTMKGVNETFRIEGNDVQYATPLIIYKPGESASEKAWNKYITINRLELRSTALSGESYNTYNRCGCVIYAAQIQVSDCVFVGSMAGVKTPAIFCATFTDCIVQGDIGFDGRVEIANATTMTLTNVYSVSSRSIGFYLKEWCYSTIVSCACDNTATATCSYVFENCDLVCNSIGSESSNNTFIKQIGGNVKIQNGFVAGHISTNEGCSYTQDGKYPFIAMLNPAHGSHYAELVITGLYETFAKLDGAISGTITSIKPFYIESRCRLYISHSDVRKRNISTEYNSEVYGKIICDELSALSFSNYNSLFGPEIVGNDLSGLLHIYRSSYSTFNVDMFNVSIDSKNFNKSNANISTPEGTPPIINCNTKNTVFKNMYIAITNNTKLFGDNFKQDIIFDNCWIIVNGNGVSTIGKGSNITFRNCWIYLNANITMPFIQMEESNITLESTRVSGNTIGWLKATNTNVNILTGTVPANDQKAIINSNSFALELYNCSHNIKLTSKPTVIANSNIGLTTIVNGVMSYWNGTAWVDITGATV